MTEVLEPDPLTTALDELRPSCTPMQSAAGPIHSGRLPFPQGVVSLHVVLQGNWLIDASLEIRRRWLERGDIVVVAGQREGALQPASETDRDARLLSMLVHLDAPHGHSLLDALPPLIRVTPGGGPLSLALCVEALLDELRIRVPGRLCMVRKLCEVLFAQALRSHLDDLSWDDQGLFRAFADPFLREYLQATADPRRGVSSGAQATARSARRIRSRFLRFTGARPSTFLRNARARRAAQLLRGGEADLERIATLTGYGSRQALARAFRQQIGVSPTDYWRDFHRRPFPRRSRSTPGDLTANDADLSAARTDDVGERALAAAASGDRGDAPESERERPPDDPLP